MDRVTLVGGRALAAACLAFAAGCGSTHSGTPEEPSLPPLGATVAAAPVTAPPESDSERLRGLLLDAAALPPNFTALPAADLSAGIAAGLSPTNPAECAKVLTPLAAQRSGALAWASVQYTGPDFSSIDIDAASYPVDAVGDAFTAAQTLLRRCVRYSGSADLPVDYRIGGLTQPPLGDAVAAFQVHSSSEGVVLRSSVAIVQVGGTLAQVAVTAPEEVDPGVLTDLTAAQVRRLRGAGAS